LRIRDVNSEALPRPLQDFLHSYKKNLGGPGNGLGWCERSQLCAMLIMQVHSYSRPCQSTNNEITVFVVGSYAKPLATDLTFCCTSCNLIKLFNGTINKHLMEN